MRLLRVEFPELTEELDDPTWSGLLHVEFGCFARYTRRAIDEGDRKLVARCFEFARRASVIGDDDVQNAVGVSFVENLDFADGKVPRSWAFELLPPSLREAAIELGVAPATRR